MKKVYLQVYPSQIVYAVFASKREGYNKNVVLKCRIEQAQVYEEYTEYLAKPIKVVTDKNDNANKYITIHFRNANIDTGYRNKHGYCYPVFTTKEKCLEWVRK